MSRNSDKIIRAQLTLLDKITSIVFSKEHKSLLSPLCSVVIDFFFNGSHPDVSRNYQNRVVSVKHNLIYSLITIILATCFDPTG